MKRVFSIVVGVFVWLLSACGSPPTQQVPTVETVQPEPGYPVSTEVLGGEGAYPSSSQPTEGAPYPEPQGGSMERGRVFIDAADILMSEGEAEISLLLDGSLPTPCHEFEAEIHEPDAENRIQVEVYSLFDPNQICTQVLEPFSEEVELGAFPQGSYTVLVNGEQAGSFEVP